MDVAILSARRGWHTAELERALCARGHRARVLPFDGLRARIGAAPRLSAGGVSLDDVDAVLVRIIPRGSLEQIIFRVDALHRLVRAGIPVLNPPSAIERTVDKYYTSSLLEEAGIPTPYTVVAERMDDALAAFRELGDVVVKPLFGSNGRGMVRISDEEIAYRVFRALELEGAIYYIQRAIPHEGRDIRAFVVGDRVVAAMWRCADHWCTNLARGARAEPATLPPAWEELSLRAARAVGAEIAGVDLLPTASGEVYVLEVNGIPGWRGLQQTTSTDIADAIVAHLERRASGS
ncbi:MAG: RimK family alpha-L-glutamate ligase [bacterium]|jgi:RimK family alpha-L-glutamate ligase|nr:MAG: 30S ribosomal protein S6--L-glutamate ligase [bacterium]HLV73297.1 RimK family alpha-L-glutamate ligase [Vulgatibacteraceae bacterium]